MYVIAMPPHHGPRLMIIDILPQAGIAEKELMCVVVG